MSVPGEADRAPVYVFGPFRLLVTGGLLLADGKPVQLGSRAFEILLTLLSRPGELVTKRELMTRVWPDTVVVEGNLTVHIAALRRALQDGQNDRRYIVNVPGRGYRFVANVVAEDGPRGLAGETRASPNNLPRRLTRLIGRDEVVRTIVAELSEHRLVTLVGPGGIGKTAVALEVAMKLAPSFKDGVWLIDLGLISDPNSRRPRSPPS
jgi:DNA-binding winged helix-turn-helix (wHTH) protein